MMMKEKETYTFLYKLTLITLILPFAFNLSFHSTTFIFLCLILAHYMILCDTVNSMIAKKNISKTRIINHVDYILIP